MYKIYSIILWALCVSCGRYPDAAKEDPKPGLNKNGDSLSKNQRIGETSNSFLLKDTLNKEETNILEALSRENEFIILSKNVERYYSSGDNSVITTRLIFTKEGLLEKGYVYYDFEFFGKITDMNINYRYSLGQGSYGYGSIVGNDLKDYVHTLKSCGVTACITQVFQNGKKIFENSK